MAAGDLRQGLNTLSSRDALRQVKQFLPRKVAGKGIPGNGTLMKGDNLRALGGRLGRQFVNNGQIIFFIAAPISGIGRRLF